jgi:predicted nucleic acid-binding protein
MGDKILIDTNVLLDYLLMREPYFEEAREVVHTCVNGKVKGCVAAHSISNMFFILRKVFSERERKELLLALCSIFDVESIDKKKLLEGLQNEKFSDFEDCLQMECAKSYGAKYIITRNVGDFSNSEIRAMTPKEYLRK